MRNRRNAGFYVFSTMLVLGAVTSLAAPGDKTLSRLSPATMSRIGTVDERFQSYNIEMVEVTGGRFWKPYASKAAESPATNQTNSNQPAGMAPSMYQYRPPINLATPRLRKLAAALGPAYLRVSGTWANTTYFQNSDDPAPAAPPKGFNGVLTRAQWKGVIDFSHAVNAELVTSFAISDGTRDAAGVWTTDQARQFLEYTKSAGGSIAATEFMNEPTFAMMGGAPAGYDAHAYARDLAVFTSLIKSNSPSTIILGPGGVGEGTGLAPASMHLLKSSDILLTTGPVFEGFSYHSYGGVSSRCAAVGAAMSTSTTSALSEDWLSRPVKIEEYYSSIRDHYEPGKPIWLTETAQTACGGDRWASTFLDSFRYLNQLGSLAKLGVQVHMHNTLAASDYGLLDENTYLPRPNYWSALLWHKLMGTTVLDPGVVRAPNLYIYGHCLRNYPGGVALLVINADTAQAQSLEIPAPAQRYTLTAQNLQDTQVQLNGVELKLGVDDDLPELQGSATRSGPITFAPASITFLALPKARNASCK
jgi:hypothetical protein